VLLCGAVRWRYLTPKPAVDAERSPEQRSEESRPFTRDQPTRERENRPFPGVFETGATGLEPATSGVTVGRRALPVLAASRH
jgi:hypothetical protein